MNIRALPLPSASRSLIVAFSALSAAGAAETVQIDVTALLNARPVTIVAGGKLVAWTEGLDGEYSGEATRAAGTMMGDAAPKALPDDGRFAAAGGRPEVALHFANEETAAKQVRRVAGADTFSFAVPAGAYARLSIFCMSANGPSSLVLRLRYREGETTRSMVVPDWYEELPSGDPDRYYLASDLAKWDKANHKLEAGHHYLYGLDARPDPGKTLTRVLVAKAAGGTLTFWGATGIREAASALVPVRGSSGGWARAASLFDGLGRPAVRRRAASEGYPARPGPFPDGERFRFHRGNGDPRSGN